MGILKGKKALIIGVASKHSIAYAIAEAFSREGADIAVTYQNEKLSSRVMQMADQWQASLCCQCDVADDQDIRHLASQIKEQWGTIDIVVHSVGFAPADELKGRFIDSCSRDGFKVAHDISTYSFVGLAQQLVPLMPESGGALLTLTYHGSQQTLPNYNVMGLAKAALEASVRYLAGDVGAQNIRVNAISAGPIKTLAASGIPGFRKMLKHNAQRSPLQRNITAKEVANTAVFLCSDQSSGITAQTIYVDGGFNSCAMSLADTDS